MGLTGTSGTNTGLCSWGWSSWNPDGTHPNCRQNGSALQAALPSLATNADGSYMKLPLWTDEWIEARGKIRVLLEYQVRCLTNSAEIRQSTPDSGLGVSTQVF